VQQFFREQREERDYMFQDFQVGALPHTPVKRLSVKAAAVGLR